MGVLLHSIGLQAGSALPGEATGPVVQRRRGRLGLGGFVWWGGRGPEGSGGAGRQPEAVLFSAPRFPVAACPAGGGGYTPLPRSRGPAALGPTARREGQAGEHHEQEATRWDVTNWAHLCPIVRSIQHFTSIVDGEKHVILLSTITKQIKNSNSGIALELNASTLNGTLNCNSK